MRKQSLQTWRLIRDKKYDGYTNMAKDEAISIACGDGKSPATLRFYEWKLPTISIGYSQKVESDINLQYCKSTGIGIVKRPTGGRAVLHENELTFSINTSIENPLFPNNILKSHKKISEALLLGIHKLGVDAKLQYKSKKQINRDPVCFSASSIYELMVDGKKIVGCAQRRFRNSFLEHGSIPLKLDRLKLASIFRNGFSLSEKRLESFHFENMAGLNELGAGSFTHDRLTENIIEGFEQYFGIIFREEALTDYEIELVRKIRNSNTENRNKFE